MEKENIKYETGQDNLSEISDKFFNNVLYNSRVMGKKEFSILYNILKKHTSMIIYKPAEYYTSFKFKRVPLQKCLDEAYYIKNLKSYGKDKLFLDRYNALKNKLSGDTPLLQEIQDIVENKK